MSATQVHVEQLYKRGHGRPLWFPDTCEVYPGDVGFFERGQDGKFCRLFNILVDQDDPLNQRGVPEGFEPLTISDRDVQYTPQAWPAGQCLKTTTVTSYEVTFKPLTYVFQCYTNGSAELRGSWERHTVSSAECREGSVLVPDHFRRKESQGSAIWDKLGMAGIPEPLKKCIDCLFVRIFRMRRRWAGLRVPLKIKAQAGPHMLPGCSSDDESISSIAADHEVEIEIDSDIDLSAHPLDHLLDYIVKAAPDAELAIVTDDDFYKLLPDESNANDIGAVLNANRPHIRLEHRSVALLDLGLTGSLLHAESSIISLDRPERSPRSPPLNAAQSLPSSAYEAAIQAWHSDGRCQLSEADSISSVSVKRGRGRPKGSKNKKTLEKERLQALAASRRTPTPESTVASTTSKPVSAGPSQPARTSRKRPASDEKPAPDAADEGPDAVANEGSSKKPPSSRLHKKAKTASSGASSVVVVNWASKSPEPVDAVPAPTSLPTATPKKRGRPSRKPKPDDTV